MKDDLLINRISVGDEDAAEELVRKFYAQVMRFCRWQCSNNDLAEDLTQETFLKVFKSLDQYRNRGHFNRMLKTYMWLMLINKRLLPREEIPRIH